MDLKRLSNEELVGMLIHEALNRPITGTALLDCRAEVLARLAACKSSPIPERHKITLENIYEIGRVASKPNWSGAGELPVPPKIVDNAASLVGTLPDDLPSPTAWAEPDGWIGLDWRRGEHQRVTISVGCGCYSYAWKDCGHRGHGNFVGPLPEDMKRFIRRLFTT